MDGDRAFHGTIGRVAAALALLTAALPAPAAFAQQTPDVTDEQIDTAVRRGLDYLYGVQGDDGAWAGRFSHQHPGGVESLVVLAALQAGEDTAKVQPLARAIAASGAVEPRTVYARAFRTMVRARLDGAENARRLREDAGWLIRAQQRDGGWGYGPAHPTTRLRPNWTDNSNSQLALLALNDAAEAGAHVPATVWRRARAYWKRGQNDDGGWGYEPPGSTRARLRASSYGSMTAGGLASLLILADVDARLFETPYDEGTRRANPPADADAIAAALGWMADHHDVDRVPGWVWGGGEDWLHFYLWTTARAMDAAGTGLDDDGRWRRRAAAMLLDAQRDDGSWARDDDADGHDTITRTCFAILCLTRTRRPVAVNKIALSGGWAHDPRDAANLVRYLSDATDRPLAWRLLHADAAPGSLNRAPILYLTGAADDEIPPAFARRIAAYAAAGGTVLVQPFAGNRAFAERARAALTDAMPGCRAGPLENDYPLFTLRREIPPDERPGVIGLGDCCRTWGFILGADLAGPWHQGRVRQSPHAFDLAVNLAAYAGLTPPSERDAEPGEMPAVVGRIGVARVRHAGQWDAGAVAMETLSPVLARAVSLAVAPGGPTDLSVDVADDVRLLVLTGTAPVELSDDARARLKRYLLGGRMLLGDSADGSDAFADSLIAMLGEMFGADAVGVLSADSDLLTGAFAGGAGAPLRDVRCVDGKPLALQAVVVDGRVAAVISRYGILCTLATRRPIGLSLRHARRLAANVLLYAAAE